MSFGNLNIKDLKWGTGQVASVWFGSSKVWPKITTVTITATAGAHVTEVTGSGEYVVGDPVTLTATVESGYAFEGWYDGSTLVSSSNPYMFVAATDLTLSAVAVQPVDIILDYFQLSNIATTLGNLVNLEVGAVTGNTLVTNISTPEVNWDATSATIEYQYGNEGIYESQIMLLDPTNYDATSSSFEQNLTDTPVVRNVTFTAVDGNTYNAQVLQKEYSTGGYTLTLTGIASYGFVADSTFMPNLDASTYDGIYKSNNYHVDSSYAVARIDFHGMPNFTVWINSYAENGYDYSIVSELDVSTYATYHTGGYTGNGYSTETSSYQGKYSNTTNYQKTHTSSATAPAETEWRKIVMTNDGGEHHVFITYRKDSSSASNDDTGCFIVEKSGQ